MIYRIKFSVSDPVNDLEEAQNYLTNDDMTKYLLDDIDDRLKSIITHIEWVQDKAISGYVELQTTDYLTEDDLNKIKEWIDGQNSDGLGAGYSDQDFANYEHVCLKEVYNEYDDDVMLCNEYEQVMCTISLDGDFELQETI